MTQIQDSVDEHNIKPPSRWTFLSPAILIIGALIIVLIAALSGLLYSSPFAPLLVGAVIAGAVLLLWWVERPIWALYAAVFIVLLPLGLIPDQYQSLLNRSLTMLALATWLFSFMFRRRYILYNTSMLAMIGFLTWGVITLLWTANLGNSLNAVQVYSMRFILFLLLISNEIRTKDSLNGLMKVLALDGWILVLSGVFVVLTQGFTSGVRLQVFGLNDNALGIYLLVMMVGVLFQASQPSENKGMLNKAFVMLYILLTIFLIGLSGSRGSAISFAITLVAFWLWKPTRIWGKFTLVILILFSFAIPFIFSTTIERFAVETGDTLLGHREALWQAAWLYFNNHPLFGAGIGQAPAAVLLYIRLFESRNILPDMVPHNPILTILVETGAIGLIFYLSVLAFAIWSFIREYRKAMQQRTQDLLPYFALVASVFLGYMASWIKGGGMESDYTYFLMLALLIIPFSLSRKEPAS